MTDNFSSTVKGLNSPADRAFVITPADSDLTIFPRALYIGGAGNVVIVDFADNEVTFIAPAGIILPVRAKQVKAASTATNIIGLY